MGLDAAVDSLGVWKPALTTLRTWMPRQLSVRLAHPPA
jgi:hypothetical protein